jgi:ribosomal protein L6, bacterial type
MSRIGLKPITIPAGVKVTINGQHVSVEGKLGKLAYDLPASIAAVVDGSQVKVSRNMEDDSLKAMHGLARSLVKNMVIGVSEGYKKELQIVGVGYKASLAGSKLTLLLGYSHPIIYDVPAGLKITVTDGVKLLIEGADKQMVGEAAARIRKYKKPEPYKGKGVRYSDEHVVIKPGKTNA